MKPQVILSAKEIYKTGCALYVGTLFSPYSGKYLIDVVNTAERLVSVPLDVKLALPDSIDNPNFFKKN